jgi:general stress protein 26
MKDETEAEKRQHLVALMKDFDTAMLVTRAADGGLRARPLAIAESEDDGSLYFATQIDSPKVAELHQDPRVSVTMQGKTKFVSVTGTARIVRDRTLVDGMWKESWNVWFPKGKDDPELCLIEIDPHEAEYWDQSGGKGLRYLFDAAKGYVDGRTPGTDDTQNAKVHL